MGILITWERADLGVLSWMPGNSRKQNPTDKQCPWCGRWFSKRGVISHRRSCPLEEKSHLEYSEEEGAIIGTICKNCGEHLNPERPQAEQRENHKEGCSYVRDKSAPSPSEAVQDIEFLD